MEQQDRNTINNTNTTKIYLDLESRKKCRRHLGMPTTVAVAVAVVAAATAVAAEAVAVAATVAVAAAAVVAAVAATAVAATVVAATGSFYRVNITTNITTYQRKNLN